MPDYREAFVGIDVAKLKNAIAIAEAGREGEVRFSVRSTRRRPACAGSLNGSPAGLVVCISVMRPVRLAIAFIALIRSLGHECTVVAPPLIPRKPGDRVKTNRRDAVSLARLLRAGELKAVWVPDESHEAMRDLVRARAAAVEALRVHRQQVSAFMLKHGRTYPRKKRWTMRYLRASGTAVRSSRASDRTPRNGRSSSHSPGAGRTSGAHDRRVRLGLVLGAARAGASNTARCRSNRRGDICHRGW